MVKISLWAGEGCLYSSITTLMDAFSIANLWHAHMTDQTAPPLFRPRILTTDGLPRTAWGGVPIHPRGAVTEETETDCVVISPVLPNICPVPPDLGSLSGWITAMRQQGAVIATVCTGAFILAEMGLLDGKTATTNWQFARMFKKRYPRVRLKPEHIMTEDDGFICTGAATAVYQLGMHLIRRFGSQKLASVCAKALLVDPNRISQAPYTLPAPLKSHGDAQVLQAQHLIETRYADITSVDDVARDVGISPRHFKRRFKAATGELPIKYLQRVRIDAAKELLETTKKTIDDITWTVGYKDISSFCRLFKQHARISPKAYRDKFYFQTPG